MTAIRSSSRPFANSPAGTSLPSKPSKPTIVNRDGAGPAMQIFREFFSRTFGKRRTLPHRNVDLELDLHETGDELIGKIRQSIQLGRSVLVTGPRGCGKSFCSEQAIRDARSRQMIGGWKFLQGNREIPRDALSEPTPYL